MGARHQIAASCRCCQSAASDLSCDRCSGASRGRPTALDHPFGKGPAGCIALIGAGRQVVYRGVRQRIRHHCCLLLFLALRWRWKDLMPIRMSKLSVYTSQIFVLRMIRPLLCRYSAFEVCHAEVRKTGGRCGQVAMRGYQIAGNNSLIKIEKPLHPVFGLGASIGERASFAAEGLAVLGSSGVF